MTAQRKVKPLGGSYLDRRGWSCLQRGRVALALWTQKGKRELLRHRTLGGQQCRREDGYTDTHRARELFPSEH